MIMSKVSIVVPCYNEEGNIPRLYEVVTSIMHTELKEYDYEILFLDNKSKDSSRVIIRDLCERDYHVKAIFQLVNCGSNANAYYGLQNAEGDCAILLNADFQEPPELIPMMIHMWESNHKSVFMIKTKSKENPITYQFRKIYYFFFRKMSDIEQISQFSGFGCYDRSFIELIRKIKDNNPFLKGIVAEYATDYITLEYEQQKRAAGVPSLNFWGYFDSAMLSFTSYTKWGLRVAEFAGVVVAVISFIIGIIYLVMKLVRWDDFGAGNAPVLIGVYFLGGCQLMFLGFIGEYIMNINKKVMDRPMNIEEERINFGEIQDVEG